MKIVERFRLALVMSVQVMISIVCSYLFSCKFGKFLCETIVQLQKLVQICSLHGFKSRNHSWFPHLLTSFFIELMLKRPLHWQNKPNSASISNHQQVSHSNNIIRIEIGRYHSFNCSIFCHNLSRFFHYFDIASQLL